MEFLKTVFPPILEIVREIVALIGSCTFHSPSPDTLMPVASSRITCGLLLDSFGSFPYSSDALLHIKE